MSPLHDNNNSSFSKTHIYICIYTHTYIPRGHHSKTQIQKYKTHIYRYTARCLEVTTPEQQQKLKTVKHTHIYIYIYIQIHRGPHSRTTNKNNSKQ